MTAQGEACGQEACPECGHPLAIEDGFPAWCVACEWNLSPAPEPAASGPLAKIYRAMGRRNAERLYDSLANAATESLKPRQSVSRLLALLVTACVHLTSVMVAAAGLWLVVNGAPDVMPVAIGLLLVAFAWMLRPRLAKLPPDTLDAAEFPKLHELVHEICDRLGVARIRHIVVDEDFNASVHAAGIRQETVLTIGLPLWMALDDRHRLAVLAHEVSHCANGDPIRGVVVGTGLSTLQEWHRTLSMQQSGEHGLPEVLAGLFLAAGAAIVEVVLLGLGHLVWRESQKAEYFADYLASTLCGTAAMVEALDRLQYAAGYLEKVLLANVVSSGQSGAAILAKFRQVVDSLPGHEIERIRRLSAKTESSLDDTHPPTCLRIAFLQAHPADRPLVDFCGDRAREVGREMATLEEELGGRLVSLVAGEG